MQKRGSAADDVRLVQVLKALADPTRLGMVRELARAGELSCGDLGRRFAVTQPTISHHLRLLGEAGLLSVRREGQHHLVSVNWVGAGEVADLLGARLARFRRRRGPARRAAAGA